MLKRLVTELSYTDLVIMKNQQDTLFKQYTININMIAMLVLQSSKCNELKSLSVILVIQKKSLINPLKNLLQIHEASDKLRIQVDRA